MASSSEILKRHFPDIDSTVLDYVNGIIEGDADEFNEAQDLHDVIGDFLVDSTGITSDDEILDICQELWCIMNGNVEQNGGTQRSAVGMRKLDKTVHLSTKAQEQNTRLEADSSIWLKVKKDESQVDQKKLEKAEARLKQKQDKRSGAPPVTNGYTPSEATASQATNRKETKMEASGSNKTFDVHIENCDIAFGDKVLLRGADIQMSFGRRYGLCGRNGIGKTTLLRMISSAQLRIPSHISMLHVEQEVVGDDTAALQSVLTCDFARERLLKLERELSAQVNSTSPSEASSDASTQLIQVYHDLEAMESDKAPSKASMILSGLGFSSADQSRPTREFSGGWRMRLALARALFTRPDLLLLDEPTNMLDMKAIIWLETYLQAWPTTMLVVSHDRGFLNSVSTDIQHMHSQRIDSYHGNYDQFVKTQMEKHKNQQREYEAQVAYRKHLQDYIDRWRYNAKRAPQAQMRIKILEKLPPLVPLVKEVEVILKFPECDQLSPPVLQLDDVGFAYNASKQIFKKICANVDGDSRICVVGDNGGGKSTLLKILKGELSPTEGLRHCHRNLRIGYFSQHHVDQLDMDVNCVELMARRFPGQKIEEHRHQLGCYGVSGDLALRPVISLSGGQKSRVAFALMAMTNPNLLILDEPTNHLDVETIEALGKAINKFNGGVILVSHDERLIKLVCKELWLVGSQCLASVEGGIDAYRDAIQAELQAQGSK
ncbi:PREDICTED: ATP-binding cassette sub-family F member 3-like [Priapulus caudatus]|uniref:ATP-binding cassette sub-family F member 3-like n=1 Tax=Priapulus caudatus TaxID=37621 RepID=A0ABM1E792_PRICU|nr:PREDICTED: ATP-binding cassette sub-family F member 3-like [Priapulus caudatus]